MSNDEKEQNERTDERRPSSLLRGHTISERRRKARGDSMSNRRSDHLACQMVDEDTILASRWLLNLAKERREVIEDQS